MGLVPALQMILASPWRGGRKGATYNESVAKASEGLGKPPAGLPGGSTMTFFNLVFFYEVSTLSIYVVVVAHVVGAGWRPC